MTQQKTDATGVLTTEQLQKLADHKHHENLGIFTQWRVGDKAGSANAIYPYYSAEQCREILDNVCGITGWTSEYREVAGYLFCSIGIYVNGELVEKSDAGGARGTRRNMDGPDKATFEAKTAASSAFVRTAKAWGIGRHIDLLPQITLSVQQGKAINPETKQQMTTDQLNAYCNQISSAVGYLHAVYRQEKALFDNNARALEVMKELKQLLEG